MLAFIIKRLGYALLILWGVLTVIFLLFTVLPGDPARMMMGQRADEETLLQIREELGLTQPIAKQYLHYVNDLSPIAWFNTTDTNHYFYLDNADYGHVTPIFNTNHGQWVWKAPYLGRSFQRQRPVSAILKETFPNTLVLALAAIVFATIIGIAMGIIAALFKNSWIDRSLLTLAALGMSIPSFFAAILMGWIFAFVLGDYTGLPLTGNLFEVDDFGEGVHLHLKHLILPSLTLGIRPLSVVLQLMRNALLDTFNLDFITTAKAKGLKFRRILFRHALPNAMNPVITAVSGWFASMLAGVVFVEYIFGWKGLGHVIVDALNKYDLPLVMGCILIIACIFILVNTLVDLVYAWLDPRVRLS